MRTCTRSIPPTSTSPGFDLGEPLRGCPQRFLGHAAQLIGGNPISTRRLAMCAGHIIDEVVKALLDCITIALAFREGMAFLVANA